MLRDGKILSNIVAGQEAHKQFGGVVPEMASRAHLQNIVPSLNLALLEANISIQEIDAIAFTQGPGLVGSLMVGVSFAKGLSLSLQKPLVSVNHIQAHVLAHLIEDEKQLKPTFPFLCLTVSGGHTQIVLVNSPSDMHILGQTNDDAAGEAFDKAAKILGLPYPGGPLIDKYAQMGNADKFKFPTPQIPDYNFSFSGLKTSMLYFVRDNVAKNPDFVVENLGDICASYQRTIVDFLLMKLRRAAKDNRINQIAIAGGVSANSGLRKALTVLGEKEGWETFIPKFEYCTDNAAMIAIAGYFRYLDGETCGLDVTPLARIAE